MVKLLIYIHTYIYTHILIVCDKDTYLRLAERKRDREKERQGGDEEEGKAEEDKVGGEEQ